MPFRNPDLRNRTGAGELATARRRGAPDHEYYRQLPARIGGGRARVPVARKLLRRSYHTLRELGEEALQPA